VSALVGFKISVQTFRNHRLELAQDYCDERWETDPEAACIGNPFLASEMIGPAYIYNAARATALVKAVAARISREKTMGRRKQMGQPLDLLPVS
jgi:hypothetical protein